METKNESSRGIIGLGLILNLLSLILYNVFAASKSGSETVAFSIYLISFIYFLAISIENFSRHRFKISKIDARHFYLLLCLLTISCFSVNLEITIFSQMPTWLISTFFVAFFSLGVQIYLPKMPEIFQVINMFLLGISIVFVGYFTVYLMPFIPFGFIGLVFFGLTIHLLVPLILLITLITHIYRAKKSQASYISLTIGIVLPLVIIASFVAKFSSVQNEIHRANSSIITRPNNDLPAWILLSQSLDDDPITEMLIKGKMVYDMGHYGQRGFTPNFTSFNEEKLHNPFVLISGGLTNKLDISNDDRLKILRTLYGNRHKATAKLWSGKDLSTSEVLTNIRIYPEYRIAYMEKIISIKNNSKRSWGQQEALYTFTLPEGSVASSLSLWINGKEEKSRLTTKAKADSAYTTIVGVEVRDPSVMHWQEGNRLVVNVFPCTTEENRRFKIGVTIPLELKSEKLCLENVKFEGPVTENTLETTVLIFETENPIENLELPNSYDETTENEFQYTGSYVDDWTVSFNNTKLSKKAFSFGDNTYKISNLVYHSIDFKANRIYLDINKSWTKDEFEEILELRKGIDIFVYYDKLIKITDKNSEKLFNKLHSLNFSLFPIDKISSKNDLIISKSTENSPNYDDLKDSKFIENISTYLSKNESEIYFYNLGENLSPFLKTLKQFRVINYYAGNISGLKKLLDSKKFPVAKHSDNEVFIPVSATIITKTKGQTNTGATDHLLRLYAYNKTVQEAGKDYFNEDFITEKLIALAEEAYIVSPVSSLIVLESQKDYDRFDIEENKNSLGNATVSGHGGVPEPHEWVLIIVAVVVLLVVSRKRIL